MRGDRIPFDPKAQAGPPDDDGVPRTTDETVDASPVVFVVSCDTDARETLSALLTEPGRTVRSCPSCREFLEAYRPARNACLVIDADDAGEELLQHFEIMARLLPVILIADQGNPSRAIEALAGGASDFIAKPVYRGELVASVTHALNRSKTRGPREALRESARNRIAMLTPRQHEVMRLVLAGHHNKNIAADLGVSRRTVENHRASIMRHTGAKSLPELARIAMAAARDDGA